jgi:hypothetical protein
MTSQEHSSATELARSQLMLDAGIHYLEHESYDYVTPTGRVYKVYGSPVRLAS